MSAISQDAFPDSSGRPLRNIAPAPYLPDPTEDIASEVTSELGGAATNGDAAQARAEPASPGSASELPQALAAGSVLRDRYALEAQLGSGGNALVFRAIDLRRDAAAAGGRHVAVKLLRPERRGEPRAVARLHREFRQTLAVTHPNVVRCFDLDCDRGCWFIVMELLTGETLAERLRRLAPTGLPAEQALAVAAAVADALAHAHGRSVIHGDVKPANIFLTDSGEVRLLDFGVTPEAADAPEPAVGTRAYASPGVLGGQPAEAGDDVYSLARVTCEMLTGSRRYGGNGAVAPENADMNAAQPAGLDDAAWQVLRRGLEPGRAQRPTMDELARALRGESRVAQAEAVPVRAAPAPAAAVAVPDVPVAGSPRRTRVIAGRAVVAGLVLLLGILIGRWQQASPPSSGATASIEPAGMSAAQAALPLPGVAPESPAARPQPEPEPETGPETAPAARVAATSLVTFDQPSMIVSNRAVVAAIPLRHLSTAPRDLKVNWRIIAGSAQPGRDYGGPESGVEPFVAGNSFRILYVPIVANSAASRDRTFVVELTGATGGAEIGGAPRVAVTILGDG